MKIKINPADKDLYLKVINESTEKQDMLNARLNPDWKSQGWAYYRAAWTEMAEAIGHLNWMWWKTGKYNEQPSHPERQQLHLELADIYHFGLSMNILNTPDASTAEFLAFRQYSTFCAHSEGAEQSTIEDLAQYMEVFVVQTIRKEEFEIDTFAGLCTACGLSLANLLALYSAKQTLNKFRWNNGYNLPKGDPHGYVKMWASTQDPKVTVEDNVHLSEIVFGLTPHMTESGLLSFVSEGKWEDAIMDELSARYSAT